MMATRPDLPFRHANPRLPTDPNTVPPVKYQVLTCQGKEILVGRMKIETPSPSGHAFILRRYDTGAVSLTTMFRAAFPSASDQEEKREVAWVKSHHDLTGTNGTSKDTSITRLAGTWVGENVARLLAEEYMLTMLIENVVKSEPDKNATYRRSAKGKSDESPPQSQSQMTNKHPTPPPNPAKRRRELSPEEEKVSSIPPPQPQQHAASPPPRRSTRAKSPSLPRSAVPMPSLASALKSPKPEKKSVSPKKPVVVESVQPESGGGGGRITRGSLKRENMGSAASDATAVGSPSAKYDAASDDEDHDNKENARHRHHQDDHDDEDDENDHSAIEHVASSDLRRQDIAEQKALIANLKAERDAYMDDDGNTKLKRAREEEEEEGEPLQFQFKEPEVEERAVAGTARVNRMGAREKSLAWGVTAFAFGLGVVTFLPNIF